MNKGIYKKLKRIADELPEVYEKIPIVVTVSGQKLLDENPFSMDSQNNPIKEHMFYRRPAIKDRRIDVEYLKRIYKSKGMPGVLSIVAGIKKSVAEHEISGNS